MNDRLRLAIQKSGRLSDRSKDLLERAGITLEWRSGRLDCRALDFPLDVMLVRDDDIPEYIADGSCHLGMVGANMLVERLDCRGKQQRYTTLRPLEFGRCRLSIAVPKDGPLHSPRDLSGKRIATSYPNTVKRYLQEQQLEAEIIEIAGSVEIAPTLGVADAICDLVSTGGTLVSNGLIEIATVYSSEAVLAKTSKPLTPEQSVTLDRLTTRLAGVVRAEKAKYIMMNAPADAVEVIRSLIPGLEEPTVMPLHSQRNRVAIHAVAPEPIFWETMERLKAAGASSILVVPIEKIFD